MSTQRSDSFGTRARLTAGDATFEYFSLAALQRAGLTDVDRLPFSIRVLLENVLRNEDGRLVRAEDVQAMAAWSPAGPGTGEVPYMPARVLLQDFTGVPAVVDLAAMRQAMQRLGGSPARINPQIPADLVIDHSVQVDRFGAADAYRDNARLEYERNRERYVFLRWGQENLRNFRVVPPETGICHQVNLEYLAPVVFAADRNGARLAFPDTCVGTDSHTTMINGLGVFGWGVGGIEAEAVMLGQPYYMLMPQVVGCQLLGELPPGATATDLVLTVTQLLRKHGVVDKFVEFYGPALAGLALADRATIANMAPEYGATMGFFPVDEQTLAYLRLSGRSPEQVALVEAYCKAQGLFRGAATPDPQFTEQLRLDLSTVEPSMAGPKRPQDRVPLRQMKSAFRDAMSVAYKRDISQVPALLPENGRRPERQDLYAGSAATVRHGGEAFALAHGAVVIAAITSCTNTSNPSVMLGAGVLARKAVERGLRVKPWVKTSLAPGSKVVTDYLRNANLLGPLEELTFHVVGYGCTTCIGNSGPLPQHIGQAIKEHNLVAAAVLSGNRNFEGRINPLTLANYLASPPLVVAYALAGTVDIDLAREPLGTGSDGRPVYLAEVWPTAEEIDAAVRSTVTPELFRAQYANVFQGDEHWRALPVPAGELYAWDAASTYIKSPPFFATMTREVPAPADLQSARVLAVLGDSVTTDHISPAGSIPADSPAGKYLIAHGVQPADFNSYGARRGNHEVMMRGTFANIRLRNFLVPGVEGGWTRHFPDGEQMAIYDAAMRYQGEGVPLIVIAGKEYGTGSSRDWAAKGTNLLGVRAVIAESYERIHRSNLVGMGVLPLQFLPGQNRETLGLTGEEVYAVRGLAALAPQETLQVEAVRPDGAVRRFEVRARVDSSVEVEYYRNGGILQTVIRSIVRQ
ncbi:MAG: aconitate hydratase AcnA [Candidatus Binatia bacterium]